MLDNELSPECLDGAQTVLKTSGISIPASYTAFIAPISTSTLFQQASAFQDLVHMETAYVVRFRDMFQIAEAQELWKFEHPNREGMSPIGHPDFNSHNSRYSSLTFEVNDNVLMHGMAAYFESVLYKDVTISINPKTHSVNMTSWFPMYFPISCPITLKKGSQVQIHLWRLTDTRKVWYEWSVEPILYNVRQICKATGIANKNGRSSWIGL